MLFDVYVAKLIEADHSNDSKVKSDLINSLTKKKKDSEILESFLFLDNFINDYIYKNIQSYLKSNTNNVSYIVKQLNDKMSCLKNDNGLNRNSLYLLEDGSITSQLPSHYKFDRAIANILKINPSSVDKNNLIVPKYSNTIRIYLEYAVLEYLPTVQQIQTLEKINIKKFYVKDTLVFDIFDIIVEKLPVFKVYK